MFQKINELSDFPFSLLHSSNICKFNFYISESLYFIAFFVAKLRKQSIRRDSFKDVKRNKKAKKNKHERNNISSCIFKGIFWMGELNLWFVKFIWMMRFNHRKQIVKVSTIKKGLGTCMIIIEC